LVTQTIVTYVMGLAGIYVLALIINALAPMFSGVGNLGQALKVAAYSATAAWVGGIFNLLPVLSLLGLLAAAYTLYLLYLGLPVLMKSPPERAMGYTVTVVIAAVVLFVVIGVVSSVFIVPPAAITQSQEEPPAVKNRSNWGRIWKPSPRGWSEPLRAEPGLDCVIPASLVSVSVIQVLPSHVGEHLPFRPVPSLYKSVLPARTLRPLLLACLIGTDSTSIKMYSQTVIA
ncbi:MAG: Yip1 family protein, partial [Nitrospiraceae bacterium]